MSRFIEQIRKTLSDLIISLFIDKIVVGSKFDLKKKKKKWMI